MIPTSDTLDVLVVGDHRDDVVRLLERQGYRAESRPGVFAAIACLRQQGARVVVLGHDDIEGHSADPVSEIREAADQARVLLLCPEARRDDRAWLDQIGADAHLVGPGLHEELTTVVGDLLEPSRNGSPGREHSTLRSRDKDELIRDLHRAARDRKVLQTLLVDKLGKLISAGRASLMSHHPPSRELFLTHASNLPETIQPGLRVKVGTGVAGRVAERARPVAIEDIEDSEFHELARDGGYRTRSFLSVPLVADARVLGVLSFADRHDGRPYTEEDLESILPIVDIAANLIRQADFIRRLRRASMLDSLTGLPNRRYFRWSRKRELKLAKRTGRPLSLLLLDADRFKEINDSLGHPAGDETLRALARVLQDVFRGTDIVCRLGGDEFAILMPETGRDRGRQAADRLERTLRDTDIPGEEQVPGGKLTVSCGLATFPEDTDDPEELVSAADRELYSHKTRLTPPEAD